MKKDRQRSAAKPPARFIAGVYNFCDRWCERCPLTRQCLRFALQSELPSSSPNAANGMSDREDFWQRLESALKTSAESIPEMARRRGIKLASAELKALSVKAPVLTAEAAGHALALKAQAYVQEVNGWFETHRQLLYGKEKDIASGAQLGVAGVYEEIASLTHTVETIRWDQYLILSMLLRGIQERLAWPARSTKDTAKSASLASSQAEGSIKVALLSIDRSISAWMKLREHFPDHTDSILSHLVELDRLRRQVTTEFPRARDFVRPGFDRP